MHVEVRPIVCGSFVIPCEQIREHRQLLRAAPVQWVRHCAMRDALRARKAATAQLTHGSYSLLDRRPGSRVPAQLHARQQ